MKLRCNAAAECGVEDCPHAAGHRPLAVVVILCNEEEMACKPLMEEPGIGEMRARCLCVPVEENDDHNLS